MIFYFPVISIIYSMKIIGNNTENIAIRRTSTLKFIILTIVTLGLYWYVWLWKLITDINKLSDKRHIHRTIWFPILIFLESYSAWLNIKGLNGDFLVNIADLAWSILQLCLALQILKNIENYILEKFEIKIKHNIFYCLLFSSLYINFKINRLPKDIKKAYTKKLEKIKESQNS